MALKFGETKGSAQKSSVDSYKYVDGTNKVRLVGDVVARYVYWLKGENNKDIPFECLAFNRGEERFDNSEKDWVKEYHPDLKCGWAYAVQIIDPTDGKVKVMNLKKKLFSAIIDLAGDLGDPTDFQNGWDVIFTKEKTGPLPINVEYKLQPIKCQKAVRPLTADELELVADLKSMDEVLPRPTPDDQKKLLDKLRSGGSKESVDEEIVEQEFNISE